MWRVHAYHGLDVLKVAPKASSASSRSAGSRSPKSVSTLAPSSLPCSRSNDLPDERRYPFVVLANERMPTHSRRVRMRRKAGFTVQSDDYLDGKFFGYDHIGSSDDEDEDAPPSPHRMPGSAAAAEVDADELSRSGSKERPHHLTRDSRKKNVQGK